MHSFIKNLKPETKFDFNKVLVQCKEVNRV